MASARDTTPQAAAIPYRRTRFGTYEVLLVSKTGGGFGLPKGGIKKGDTAEDTARAETLEEAGVLGEVEARLGEFRYRKRGRKHEVAVFALRVERILSRWQEDGRRVRVWVPIAEAPRLLGDPAVERLLTRLRHRLLAASFAVARAA